MNGAAPITVGRTTRALESQLKDILTLLEDPTVEDVFVNPDGKVWVNQRERLPYSFGSMDSGDVWNVINLVASYNRTVCNADKPILEAILPFRGARFQAMIPPVVAAPAFAIRLRPQSIYTLDQYIQSGVMTARHAEALIDAIASYRNVLLVGGTGSGKTTLLNAVLAELAIHCADDRIVSIEDTPELQCSSENYTALFTGELVSMAHCLRAALRLRPTRIIVGEVRGPEALDLLKAWNTGHPGGLATVHANGGRDGLERMEQLAREATEAPQQQFIASTVNLCVFLAPDITHPAGRRVRQVLEVTGYRDGDYQFKEIAS